METHSNTTLDLDLVGISKFCITMADHLELLPAQTHIQCICACLWFWVIDLMPVHPLNPLPKFLKWITHQVLQNIMCMWTLKHGWATFGLPRPEDPTAASAPMQSRGSRKLDGNKYWGQHVAHTHTHMPASSGGVIISTSSSSTILTGWAVSGGEDSSPAGGFFLEPLQDGRARRSHGRSTTKSEAATLIFGTWIAGSWLYET